MTGKFKVFSAHSFLIKSLRQEYLLFPQVSSFLISCARMFSHLPFCLLDVYTNPSLGFSLWHLQVPRNLGSHQKVWNPELHAHPSIESDTYYPARFHIWIKTSHFVSESSFVLKQMLLYDKLHWVLRFKRLLLLLSIVLGFPLNLIKCN